MRLVMKLRLMKACLLVIRDPSKTDEILKITEYIKDPKIYNLVLNRLKADVETAKLIAERYSGQEIDLDGLLELPPESLGYRYACFMKENKLDPNFYRPIQSDDEFGYARHRGRQVHDIWHVMTGFDTSVSGEAGLQAFTLAQVQSSFSAIVIALFILHFAIYHPKNLPAMLDAITDGWRLGKSSKPLFSQRWENQWDMPLQALRKNLAIDRV